MVIADKWGVGLDQVLTRWALPRFAPTGRESRRVQLHTGRRPLSVAGPTCSVSTSLVWDRVLWNDSVTAIEKALDTISEQALICRRNAHNKTSKYFCGTKGASRQGKPIWCRKPFQNMWLHQYGWWHHPPQFHEVLEMVFWFWENTVGGDSGEGWFT